MWYYNDYQYIIIIDIITILICIWESWGTERLNVSTQGHTAKKVRIWQSNPGSLAPDSVTLTTMLGFMQKLQ